MHILGFLRDSAWDKMDAVAYYRTYLPLRELNRQIDIEAKCIGKEIDGLSDDELGGQDIYTMCRMYNEGYQEFIDEIHRRGGLFVFDSDDDLTETYKLVSGHGDEFKEVLAAADYVTCTTPNVAILFSEYAQKPVRILRNCVDVAWMQQIAAGGKRLVDGLTLGFTGSPTHWGDWYIPAVPFARIGKDFPDVTLLLHGECPRYLGFAAEKAQMLKLGGVPFSIYPILLKQFDIVLCAVDSRDVFNSGKSAIKALECMALGVVPICSNFRPYLELAAQGAPVVIVADDSRDGWYEAMRDLITDDVKRTSLSAYGPEWVRAHRDMTVSGYKRWESFYREIT
jgi:glycosyltransferase involved in cell wall biosynthesis